MRRVSGLLIVAACSGTSGDDSADASAPCTGPFAAPQSVSFTGQLGGRLTLSNDELTAYFALQLQPNTGITDLYSATRISLDAPFGEPTLLMRASERLENEHGPSLSTDGLELIFASSDNAAASRLWRSTRTDATAEFGPRTSIPGVTGMDYGSPFLSRDEIYFSFRPGATNVAIGRATRTATGFTNIDVVAALPDRHATSPVVSFDGLTLYYASGVMPGQNYPYAIWVATRRTTADEFGLATMHPEINVAGEDQSPSWISPDGCRLYLIRAEQALRRLGVYVAARE